MTPSAHPQNADTLDRRLASLSPEKRQLFERLRRHPPAAGAPAETAAPQARATPGAAAAPAGLAGLASLEILDGEKANTQRFYDAVSEQLDPTPFGPFAFFLNYGFVSDGSREFAAVSLPEHCLNRNSVKLVVEVVGDCPLAGRSVLDVGCGRGGTVATLHEFYRPARICALDLSPSAIRFCRQTHRFAEARFLEGDAEHLPFEDACFDAVINIESSHLYPDIAAFYREVFRVLRTGGRFLYADLQSAERWQELQRLLRGQSFELVRDRDITANVLLSCDQVARARVEAYQSAGQSGMIEEFLAAPGSRVYAELQRRAWAYRILTLRKP